MFSSIFQKIGQRVSRESSYETNIEDDWEIINSENEYQNCDYKEIMKNWYLSSRTDIIAKRKFKKDPIYRSAIEKCAFIICNSQNPVVKRILNLPAMSKFKNALENLLIRSRNLDNFPSHLLHTFCLYKPSNFDEIFLTMSKKFLNKKGLATAKRQ